MKRSDFFGIKKFTKQKYVSVVDLRAPPQNPKRLFFGMFALVLAAGGVFMVGRTLINAETTTLFPETCLGTWKNPENAEGKPETFGSDPEIVSDETNAAVYEGGTHSILCGGFMHNEIETAGEISGVRLTLVMRVEHGGPENHPPAVEENPSSTTPAVPFSLKTSRMRQGDLGSWFVPLARAEETSTAAGSDPKMPPPEESGEAADNRFNEEQPEKKSPEPPPEPGTLEPPAQDEGVGTTTIPAPAGDEQRSLGVKYSFDGKTWSEAGTIGATHTGNFTAVLPVDTWEKLRALQITVEGTSSFSVSPVPKAYLDGMVVEVAYHAPFLSGANKESMIAMRSALTPSSGESGMAELARVRAWNMPTTDDEWAEDVKRENFDIKRADELMRLRESLFAKLEEVRKEHDRVTRFPDTVRYELDRSGASAREIEEELQRQIDYWSWKKEKIEQSLMRIEKELQLRAAGKVDREEGIRKANPN